MLKHLKTILFLVFIHLQVYTQTTVNFKPATDLQFAPVFVPVKKTLSPGAVYELIDQNSGTHTLAQATNSSTLAFIPTSPLQAMRNYSYKLAGPAKTAHAVPVEITSVKNGLQVSLNKKPVLFYHITQARPPADSPAYYQRSGFIHPLYSPAGKVLTDDFPAGHAHQHAVFTAWTSTRFRNHPVDFWNQHQQTGTVKHIRLMKTIQGPVFSEFQVLLNHISLQDGPVLQETWTVRIFPFQNFYLVDLHSEQQNITSDTLFLNKYHYGGIGFRGSMQWNPDDKTNFKSRWKLITSEGKQDSAANASLAKWVDASGMIDGEIAGVTVLSHPSNFRFPQPIRVHPTMPYWCYAPTVNDAFYIPPGGVYRSDYRYYIHDGKTDPQLISRLFEEYAQSPVD